MRRRCAAAAVAMMAAVTACSGGDDAAPSTTVDVTVAPTTVATTTATTTPTTTAPAPTTPAPAPTTAPTSQPPTNPAPVTTAPLDPIADLAAAIERDLNLGEQALFVIGADPAAANVQQLAEQYFTGESLASVLSGVQALVQDDLVLQPDPDIPNIIRLVTEPTFDAATSQATAQTCRIDAAQVWARVNDTDVRAPISSGAVKILAASIFVLVDGTWKLADGESISREQDVATCD